MHSAETWRPIVGYESGYMVSDLGNVRRSDGMPIRPFRQTGKKYMRVNLYDGRKQLRQFGVHQLVMAAFVGPPPELHVINHIDADPANNRLANLEYVTQKQNAEHAAAMGLCVSFPGERNPQAKLTASDVAAIRSRSLAGERDGDIAADMGVSKANIVAIRTRKTWRHVA